MIGIVVGGIIVSTIVIAFITIGIKIENENARRFKEEQTWEW